MPAGEIPDNIPSPDPSVITTQRLTDTKTEIMMLVNEKLERRDERMNHMEKTRIEQKADTTKNLDAAFEAAKEGDIAMGLRIDDLKERVTRMESSRAGLYAAAIIVAAVIGLVGFILANGTNP